MILPRPADAFEWREAGGRSALVCRPMADVAAHLFTTRHWRLGLSGRVEDAGWSEVADALDAGADALVRARQVHGAAIIEGRQESGSLSEADILLAREDGLVPAVQVADCVPLLIADPVMGAVAAVHAGWRGLAMRAPAAAVTALHDRMGSDPDDLIVALGPSIGACCYQVGQDVRAAFVAEGCDDAILDTCFLRTPRADPDNPPMPGLDGASRGDRWFFDSWATAIGQLVNAGVRADRVFASRLCTASHPEVFCSYRRDGHSAGRLAAAIRARLTPRSHPAA